MKLTQRPDLDDSVGSPELDMSSLSEHQRVTILDTLQNAQIGYLHINKDATIYKLYTYINHKYHKLTTKQMLNQEYSLLFCGQQLTGAPGGLFHWIGIANQTRIGYNC